MGPLAKFVVIITLITTFVLCGLNNLSAQTNESMIHTVYSEKFTRFISWPPESKVVDTLQDFTICVAGETETLSYFNQLFDNNQKKIKNKYVNIISNPEADDYQKCDLIYFGKLNSRDFENIVSETKGLPILTISETENNSTVIYFFTKSNKVLFNINTEIASQQRLKISHLLLKLSTTE